MAPYAHKKQYELRYSDFDFKDELRLSSLLAVVQESACMSADELGFGYDALKPKNFGFIIVNTYCEFRRPVRLGEAIAVETWPLPPRHVIFERDYRVTADGEEAAVIASRWCLVDLQNFALLTPEKLGSVHAQCPYRNEKSVVPPAWKIPRTEHARAVYEMCVKTSHCDHYYHANNAQYADFFSNCFTVREFSRPIASFQIAYIKQAKEGQKLVFWREDRADGALCEARGEDGELYTQFSIVFA